MDGLDLFQRIHSGSGAPKRRPTKGVPWCGAEGLGEAKGTITQTTYEMEAAGCSQGGSGGLHHHPDTSAFSWLRATWCKVVCLVTVTLPLPHSAERRLTKLQATSHKPLQATGQGGFLFLDKGDTGTARSYPSCWETMLPTLRHNLCESAAKWVAARGSFHGTGKPCSLNKSLVPVGQGDGVTLMTPMNRGIFS